MIPNQINLINYGDYEMPTSYDTNLHFLAKKAKNRLAGRNDETQSDYSKYMNRVNETYMMILRMAIEEQTVYNPIKHMILSHIFTISSIFQCHSYPFYPVSLENTI